VAWESGIGIMRKQKPEFFEGLEHSCAAGGEDRIRAAPALPGIERVEARFTGAFFEPHRHDTYAVGVTLSGVQTFRYRGGRQVSLPGRIIVLHPDEIHDGAAGTDAGLRYRMLYLDPALVRRALGATAPLPFVRDPVLDDPILRAALVDALGRLDETPDDLALADLVDRIAQSLARHGKRAGRPAASISPDRINRARDYLCDNALRDVRSRELEDVTGLDRFTLSRQFRALFATSPHRFLIMRRLDHARRLIAHGETLADTAAAVGFADQSHLTRHFKKSFGITPGRWARATRASRAATERA